MPEPAVNNACFDALGDRWYEADDDPIALLRAESKLRNPWVERSIRTWIGFGPCRVLDVGCGGGFLANHLALSGHRVTGLDSSTACLAVAARHDRTGSARYVAGDAFALPFADGSFDAVCALDFLEHVQDVPSVLREMERVVAPGGLVFFHTFDRNPLAWLVVIKGVEWFVKNTPPDMHLLARFLKPRELATWFGELDLEIVDLRGSRPCFDRHMWRLLCTGVVPAEFSFTTCSSTRLGYGGVARKRSTRRWSRSAGARSLGTRHAGPAL